MIYKHVCLLCKSSGKSAIYWGQTSRTLGERAAEHDGQLTKKLPQSHAYPHLQEYHPELADLETIDPKWFKWEVVGSARNCFERLVWEAVRIKISRHNPTEITLNNKDEFGSYELPELTIAGKEALRPKLNLRREDFYHFPLMNWC